MRIGVIADTHGYLDPHVARHFYDVERILHAGDIGALSIITQLERIAPVVGVHGNVDVPPLNERFPRVQLVEVGELQLMLTHITGLPERMPPDVRQQYERLRPHIVVFGHSHQMQNEIADGGTRFFNPGAAGKQGFHRTRSIGLLDVRGRDVRATHIELLPRYATRSGD